MAIASPLLECSTLLSLVVGFLACGSQPAVLIGPGAGGAPPVSGTDSGTGGSEVCPARLVDRLRVTTVDVDVDVGYVERGYDSFPKLSRIQLAVQPDGNSQVAYRSEDRATLHVVPLGSTALRRGADAIVQGLELGGLVAHNDGFAVLTRVPEDASQDLSTDPLEGVSQAAVLVRHRNGAEAYRVVLTGKASPNPSFNYSTLLFGRLVYDGTLYGSYFAVRGGQGSPRAGTWGDQLSESDDLGQIAPGGFTFGCSLAADLRLRAAGGGRFEALCLSDNLPSGGLNWMTEGQVHPLAYEERWSGYSAGRLGAVVGLADGTRLVVWASRGDGGPATPADGETAINASHLRAKDAPDLALLRVAADGTPQGPVTWLTDTPGTAEFTVHVAPYGRGRYLVIWSALGSCRYLNGNCYGAFAGTFARIVDADGNPLSADEALPAWPSDDADLAVFPNGDIGWAFVDVRPNYVGQLDASTVPKVQALHVARLAYCQ